MIESIAIVGAGQCGATAAMSLRTFGFGGRIVLLGDEPIAPYERPPLSKAVLCENAAAPTFIASPGRYEEIGVEYIAPDRALSIDPQTRTVLTTRGHLRYDRLLLAIGGTPRIPSRLAATELSTLRTWDDAVRLQRCLAASRHVTVIGGGLIGLEVAASSRVLGLAVTVVEARRTLLSRLVPETVGRRLLSLHQNNGVEVFTGRTPERVTRTRTRRLVELDCGTSWETDLIVAGIGLDVPVELAETAGCRCDDGILVDERGATNVHGIFAAGDCARFPQPALGGHTRWENWQHSIRHGTHVASCMIDRPSRYNEVCRGWSDQFNTNLCFVGDPVAGSRLVTREISEDRVLFCSLDQDRIVGAVGWNAAREIRVLQRFVQERRPVDPTSIEDRERPLAAMLAHHLTTPAVEPRTRR